MLSLFLMKLILIMQEKIRTASASFLLNKKWIRNVGMSLLGLILLFGIMRTCFFYSGHAKTYYLIPRSINWDDFQFSGKEPNMQAFAEELILAASKEAHLRIELVSANSSTLIEDLNAGNYDAVFTFMVPNSLNEEKYYFSDPLYMLGDVLVVNADSDVHNLEDMEGKMVGISAGSSSIYEVDHYPSIIIVTYENMNSALNDLANNKIDGVIMDDWSANVNLHGFFSKKLKIATIPFTRQGLRLVSLREPDLIDFMKSINDGLERLKASGQYQKLIKKWDLYDIQ